MKDLTVEKLRYPIGRIEWKPKKSKKRLEFHKIKNGQFFQLM